MVMLSTQTGPAAGHGENKHSRAPTPVTGLPRDGEHEEVQGQGRRGAEWPQQWADGAQRNLSTGAISVSSLYLVLLENHLEKRQRDFCKALAQMPGKLPPACHRVLREQTLECIEHGKY